MLSEFIDAYSDDQIYLAMLEEFVNEHEVEGLTPDNIKYSSFTRLWTVMMVGGVECMIKEWAQNRDGTEDVYSYFEQGSNVDRIERLKKAFMTRDIQVDVSAFEDFLAAKYIRNAYVHAQWNEDQRAFVVQRGYPDTLMSFERSHLNRVKASYEHVMMCLGKMNVFHTMVESQAQRDRGI